MKNYRYLTLVAFLLLPLLSFCQDTLQLHLPDIKPAPAAKVQLEKYKLTAGGGALLFDAPSLNGAAVIKLNGTPQNLLFKNGKARLEVTADARGQLIFLSNGTGENKNSSLHHISKNSSGQYRLKSIPLWLSIIPPLIAIVLALIFKEVVISLFAGIWAGAFIAGGMRVDSIYYLLQSFLEVVQIYIVEALADSGHLSVIVFSMLIGGMVAIISRNGGMAGVVKSLSKYARSPRSAQLVTWLLGVAIFFDDYANTLIVGNTMRSVTDKFRISREKLAYIVDSTAAPVTSIAFITTWIGAELGYIEDGIAQLENFNTGLSPYAIFLSSLKYSFYPILTLGFILILVLSRRDYGPMAKAEIRARTTGRVSSLSKGNEENPGMEDLSPILGVSLKWYNAALPVMAVILMTIIGLIDTGIANTYVALMKTGAAIPSESWSDVWAAVGASTGKQTGFFMKIGTLIGNSDSYIALLWASLSGLSLAVFMTLSTGIMKLFDTMHTMTTGFKAMLPALIILILAWALAITTVQLHTADYITAILQGNVSPYLLPGIIFILAAAIAFSTGSSWSTMAILYPIAIPTTWAICMAQGLETNISMELLYNVIAVVLAASVLGDHCSPISDTTILSSLASGCNHIEHVRTQMPYAMTVGTVSLVAGIISTMLGGGWLVFLLLITVSFIILTGVVLKFGKQIK